MADRKRAVPGNVPGPWFVDDTCIDCDASRQCAPAIFSERRGQSIVVRQPETDDELRAATRAMLACPTGSIGASGFKPALDVFPELIADGVYYTGFNSPRAYGGNAWLVTRPQGNVLIDGPRFTPHLVSAFERLGGLSDVVFTHRDDLGDADEYAERFKARVWIHEADAAGVPFATELFRGPMELRPGLRVLSTPGHTRGSVMFLLEDRFLFTGDSLFWSRDLDTLHAHRQQCWHSWPRQIESLENVAQERFEHVLPGHGGRAHRPAEVMHERLLDLVRRMRAPSWVDAW
jgi:glyoxylase-like metal-dependent hydrolase (beta-lactamase superfamily II)/ferredoxin